MFYSQLILARKGPLGKIWLAAHYDKKLTKAQIFLTDITESVESILHPSVPLALRVSGHLMLGIVRIYSKKVKYLVADCTEAMWKIKMAFKPGSVDLVEVAGAAHLAIDDPRFYGNIEPEQEYPDLEDVAFSQSALTRFAQRRSTLAPEYQTIEAGAGVADFLAPRRGGARGRGAVDDEPSFDIPDVMPGEEFFRSRASEDAGSSKRSRFSEIEIMRGRASSISAIHPRPSFASDRSAQAGLGSSRFDDEIPAFEELGQEELMPFGEEEAPPMDVDYYGDYEQYGEPPEIEGGIVRASPLPSGAEQIGRMRLDESIAFGRRKEVGARAVEGDMVGEQEGEEKDIGEEGEGGGGQRRKKKAKKGVKPDALIEINSHEIKKHMHDVSSTLRRVKLDCLSGKPAPSLHLADWINPRPAVHDMCSELQEMFLVTMTTRALPFPYKDDKESRLYRTRHKDNLAVVVSATGLFSTAGGAGASAPEAARQAASEEKEPGAHRRRTASLLGAAATAAQLAREDEEALAAEGQDMQYGLEYGGDLGGMEYYGGDAEQELPMGLGLGPIPEEEAEGMGTMEGDYEQLNADEPLLRDVIRQQQRHRGGATGDVSGSQGGGGSGIFAKVDLLSYETPDLEADLEEQDIDFALEPPAAARARGRVGAGNKGDWSARTVAVMGLLKDQLTAKEELSFAELSADTPKRKIIACFAEILQLKTFGYIDCAQSRPFADIHITATDKLWGQ